MATFVKVFNANTFKKKLIVNDDSCVDILRNSEYYDNSEFRIIPTLVNVLNQCK